MANGENMEIIAEAGEKVLDPPAISCDKQSPVGRCKEQESRTLRQDGAGNSPVGDADTAGESGCGAGGDGRGGGGSRSGDNSSPRVGWQEIPYKLKQETSAKTPPTEARKRLRSLSSSDLTPRSDGPRDAELPVFKQEKPNDDDVDEQEVMGGGAEGGFGALFGTRKAVTGESAGAMGTDGVKGGAARDDPIVVE
jgi:hypothetical protein